VVYQTFAVERLQEVGLEVNRAHFLMVPPKHSRATG
jgi:hypothetical protein